MAEMRTFPLTQPTLLHVPLARQSVLAHLLAAKLVTFLTAINSFLLAEVFA
jgi:hypothetical protein